MLDNLWKKEEMSTYILGISCYYHDASAALLKDGEIVAASDEERFTRIKHDTSFPINAIAYCLKSLNITIKDISFIGFYEKPLLKFERILYQHLESFPLSLGTFLKAMPSWFGKKLKIITEVRKRLKYSGDVLFIEHHLAHAASAFLVSPFKEAAILTVDGVGEWTTTAFGFGEGEDIRLIKEIKFPSSLGLLYSTITAYLGFKVNNSEYKVMGLSAYGNMNRKMNPYYAKLKQVIDIKKDGSFCMDMSYFAYSYANKMPSKKLCRLLGGRERKPETEVLKRHMDIASALQMVYEDAFFLSVNHVYSRTKCRNLVLAGGSALNSVANGKIVSNSPFEQVWIQPNASDGGTSMGAVSYIYNSILGNKRSFVLDNAYLGPEFSDKEIEYFLNENGISYSVFKDTAELIEKTAGLIYDNNVVGWFQGRMEWGPRALGNRSILANPCNPDAKRILNEKVKHREKFRPFAPAVCEEDVFDYFEADAFLQKPSDFMLLVYPVKEEKKKEIPSVTHVDGSGRLQVVKEKNNPLFYRLIKEFGRKSGTPVVINTSFNIRGEPIVCAPDDAYRCMMGTGIDFLVMGKFLIKRGDNLLLKDTSDKRQ